MLWVVPGRSSPRLSPLYRPLPSGNRGLEPERVSEHQRMRLMGAMLHAVSEHGFPSVTVAELAQLAAVSHRAFYEHFADKEECFVVTHDFAVAEGTARISAAYRAQPDWREGLRAGFAEYFAIVAEEPRAAHLVIVDALNAGARARAARRQAMATFERMLRESIAQAEGPNSVDDVTIGAIVAGTRHVVYRHLRDGRTAELPAATETVLAWALGLCDATRRHPLPQSRPLRGRPVTPKGGDPADHSRDARDRILDAVCVLCAPDGYSGLGMPAITSTARCSSQTFYRHFADKEEAFLAAFDLAAVRAGDVLTRHAEESSRAPARASAGSWQQSVAANVDALLAHFAAYPAEAALLIRGILTGPLVGLTRAEHTLQMMVEQLSPPAGAPVSLPAPQVVNATAGAIAHLLQEQLATHGAQSFPALGDQITYIIVAAATGAPG
jgi:AcrR family transcriptional regulator